MCAVAQVTFPLELDVYDFCTPELQKQLAPARDALKDYQDKLAMVGSGYSGLCSGVVSGLTSLTGWYADMHCGL